MASLVEVGTGFHPERTGRENVYLNGPILGMRRALVAKDFDAIVDFVEGGYYKSGSPPAERTSAHCLVRQSWAVEPA